MWWAGISSFTNQKSVFQGCVRRLIQGSVTRLMPVIFVLQEQVRCNVLFWFGTVMVIWHECKM